MGVKAYTFEEELPMPVVTLALGYEYYYRAAVTSCLPENCSPEEEESTVTLPIGWRCKVLIAYIEAAHKAMDMIENSLVPDLELWDAPREWAEEDADEGFTGILGEG